MEKTFLLLMALFCFGQVGQSSTVGNPDNQFNPVDYYSDVKPIFESRCIQCHSCYNAPCQLKLSSPDGIRRGLIKDYNVYDPTRLRAFDPTRLGVDADSAQEWHSGQWHLQKKGMTKALDKAGFSIGVGERKARFSPIVPLVDGDYSALQDQDPQENFIVRLIQERSSNLKPVLDEEYFAEMQSENSRVCPITPDELSDHISQRAAVGSSAGMPYGLPALNERQISKIENWIAQGAPLPASGSVPEAMVKAVTQDQPTIDKIETFLNNQSDASRRLVSRYIYEHLFISEIYLSESNASGQFYKLVRSFKSCDSRFKMEEVPTRRPWNAPIKGSQVDFWYCLKPIEETITHKTHIIYKIDSEKIDRWEDLFFNQEPWQAVWDRPTEDAYASNPFFTFQDIPVKARYQFLLDDAQHFVMAFIRGPACKGSMSTNSIDEQFHVLFLKPDSDPMVLDGEFAKTSQDLLVLPAKRGSEQANPIAVGVYKFDVEAKRKDYLAAREVVYQKHHKQGYGLDDLWLGVGNNDAPKPNTSANLTVLRNHESATVVQGLVGPTAKTTFVLDYSLLERLYYLLVAGYDVYGDIYHQLHTRLYMGFLRIDAEDMYLKFMPPHIRQAQRNSWYIPSNSASEKVTLNWVQGLEDLIGVNHPTQVKYSIGQMSVGLKTQKRFVEEAQDEILKLAYADRDVQKKVRKLVRGHFKSQGMTMKAVGTEPAVTIDREQVSEIEQLLAAYRVEFNNKIKQAFNQAGSRGYVDSIHSDDLRYDSESLVQRKDYRRPQWEKPFSSVQEFEDALAKIMGQPATFAPWVLQMPNNALLLVETPGVDSAKDGTQSELYTLVRQKEHYNVGWIAGEGERRNYWQDNVIAYKGVVGSYPNMIFHISLANAHEFLSELVQINEPVEELKVNLFRVDPGPIKTYKSVVAEFGSPRAGPGSERFWSSYDRVMDVFFKKDPIAAGYLDLNRYGLR